MISGTRTELQKSSTGEHKYQNQLVGARSCSLRGMVRSAQAEKVSIQKHSPKIEKSHGIIGVPH